MYIVSACLAGVRCRYDGNDNMCEAVKKLVEEGKAIPVCPEVLGGLSTPRIPCEQILQANGEIKIVNKNGDDCTEAFSIGAQKTLQIAKIVGAQVAILKSKSPSCGCGKIYNGQFNKTLIFGDGLTTKMLKQNGLKIYDETFFNLF